MVQRPMYWHGDHLSHLTPRRLIAGGILLIIVPWLAFSSCSGRRTQNARLDALSTRIDDVTSRLKTAEEALAAQPTQEQVRGLHIRLVNVERKLDEERIGLSDALAMKKDVAALRSGIETAKRDARAAQAAAADASKKPPQIVLRPNIEPPEVKIEPKINLNRSPSSAPKKSVDVIVKSVHVASTKRGGDQWDGVGDGSPDPKVHIAIRGFGGGSGTTSVIKNTFAASFNEKILRVSEGDEIRITVFDDDALSDDIVGTYDKELTADTFRERTVRWAFDQVETLVLEFQP